MPLTRRRIDTTALPRRSALPPGAAHIGVPAKPALPNRLWRRPWWHGLCVHRGLLTTVLLPRGMLATC
jgi:hypothetical protein